MPATRVDVAVRGAARCRRGDRCGGRQHPEQQGQQSREDEGTTNRAAHRGDLHGIGWGVARLGRWGSSRLNPTCQAPTDPGTSLTRCTSAARPSCLDWDQAGTIDPGSGHGQPAGRVRTLGQEARPMAPSRLPGLLPAQLRPETVSSSSGSWRGGSGSAIGGSGGVPVIRRDPRP